MNPGTLNKRLTINSVSDVSDGAGGYEEALTPIKTVWGNIRPITGREFYEARFAQVEVSHIATIRLDAAVNRTHVITCGSSKYHIQYIIERSNTLLELHITERK